MLPAPKHSGQSSALMLCGCFNLGLWLPSLLVIVPGDVRLVIVVLMIGAVSAGIILSRGWDWRSRSALGASVIALLCGFTIVCLLPFI
jgi:hypothetical protein